MSQSLISISESLSSFYQLMTEKYCSDVFSIEILESIITQQSLTPLIANQIFSIASFNLLNNSTLNESKLIDLIQLLKKYLNLQDYCSAIILANPFNDCSFLHSIAFRKNKLMTEFFLNEINQMIDMSIINKEQISILFNSNLSRATGLLLICRMGDEQIFLKFFSILFNAYGNNLIDNQGLKDLLTKKDRLAFNPLHMLLNNGNVETIDYLLTFIIVCHHYKVLSSLEYAALISEPTKDGYTPLHDAIKTNNPILVGKILRLNFAALELGISTPDIFENLLSCNCKGGFNPLQKIYLTNNMEIMRLYIQTMHDAVIKGYITNQILKNTFLHINDSHFSVYFDVIGTANTILISNHIAILRFLLGNAFINTQDYAAQMLSPNNQGFNILYQALKTGNSEIIDLVFTDITHLLPKENIQQMAFSMMIKFGVKIKLDILKNKPQPQQQLSEFLKQHDAQDAIKLLERPCQISGFFKPHNVNNKIYQAPQPK